MAGRHPGDGRRLRARRSRSGRRIGDQREIANALYNDSFRYAVERDGPASAIRIGSGFKQMHRARDLATEAGDERGRANALWGIGNWLYFHNADDRGIGQFEEALGVFRAARRPDDGGVVPPHARDAPDPARRDRSTARAITSRPRCACSTASATWPASP